MIHCIWTAYKQLKVHLICILKEIDPFYWPKMHFLKQCLRLCTKETFFYRIPSLGANLPICQIWNILKTIVEWNEKKTILSCELSYQNILSYISLDEPETRRVMLYEVSIWAAGANDRNLSYAVAHTENKYRQNIQNICKANKQTNILKNTFECEICVGAHKCFQS